MYENFKYHLSGLNALYRKLCFVSITAVIVLCALSCRTPKETKSNHIVQTDSLMQKKAKGIYQEPIPPSMVTLTTTPTKLEGMLAGTGYHLKQGQASLNVIKEDDGSLTISASCDSLQRLVLFYEEETSLLRSQLEEATTEKPPDGPTGWQWFWIRIGQLAVIYAVCRYLLPKAIKWITTFLKK